MSNETSLGTVQLRERQVYGVQKYYPANRTAEIFCKISKSVTMTEATIAQIKLLGYEVQTDRIEFADA